MSISISEQDISGVTEAVWVSMLDLPVLPALDPAPPTDDERLVGQVHISGAWTGTVHIVCSGDVARTAAAAIFGGPPEQASPRQSQDALAEIINMTAGNLKALLPEPCQLGLPAVSPGDAAGLEPPGSSHALIEVGFTCLGSPFLVRVVSDGDA